MQITGLNLICFFLTWTTVTLCYSLSHYLTDALNDTTQMHNEYNKFDSFLKSSLNYYYSYIFVLVLLKRHYQYSGKCYNSYPLAVIRKL